MGYEEGPIPLPIVTKGMSKAVPVKSGNTKESTGEPTGPFQQPPGFLDYFNPWTNLPCVSQLWEYICKMVILDQKKPFSYTFLGFSIKAIVIILMRFLFLRSWGRNNLKVLSCWRLFRESVDAVRYLSNPHLPTLRVISATSRRCLSRELTANISEDRATLQRDVLMQTG